MGGFAISGSTGYLGTHLMPHLVNSNAEVKCLIRKPLGPNEVYFDLQKFTPSNELAKSLNSKTLIHLAWVFGDNQNFESNQLADHLTFLEFAIESGVKSIITTGTLHEFSLNRGPITASSVPDPVTKHGEEKVKLHNKLIEICAKSDVSLTWLRMHYLYGDDLISRSLFGKLKRGEISGVLQLPAGLFDFQDVRNASETIFNHVKKRTEGTLDIGSGEPLSWFDAISLWSAKEVVDLSSVAFSNAGTANQRGTWPIINS